MKPANDWRPEFRVKSVAKRQMHYRTLYCTQLRSSKVVCTDSSKLVSLTSERGTSE